MQKGRAAALPIASCPYFHLISYYKSFFLKSRMFSVIAGFQFSVIAGFLAKDKLLL